jgi:hypothetical protein
MLFAAAAGTGLVSAEGSKGTFFLLPFLAQAELYTIIKCEKCNYICNIYIYNGRRFDFIKFIATRSTL